MTDSGAFADGGGVADSRTDADGGVADSGAFASGEAASAGFAGGREGVLGFFTRPRRLA